MIKKSHLCISSRPYVCTYLHLCFDFTYSPLALKKKRERETQGYDDDNTIIIYSTVPVFGEWSSLWLGDGTFPRPSSLSSSLQSSTPLEYKKKTVLIIHKSSVLGTKGFGWGNMHYLEFTGNEKWP